jgi:hypothetical protein
MDRFSVMSAGCLAFILPLALCYMHGKNDVLKPLSYIILQYVVRKNARTLTEIYICNKYTFIWMHIGLWKYNDKM